jgi:hypothetical protein
MSKRTPNQAPATPATSLVDLRERLGERAGEDHELIFLDPPDLDVAIVGLAERLNFGPVVVYDRNKLHGAFMGMGMDEDEAHEWISFNIEGAYIGEATPLILTGLDQMD